MSARKMDSGFFSTVLLWTGRVFAFISAIVLALLLINAGAAGLSKPAESAAMESLRLRLSSDPGNEALADDLRSLDLLSRRAFFTSRSQSDALSLILLASIVVSVASFKARSLLSETRQDPKSSPPPSPPEASSSKILGVIAAIAAVTLALSSLIASRDLPADFRKAANALGLGGFPSIRRMAREWPQFRGAGAGIVETADDLLEPEDLGVLFRSPIDLPGHNSPIVWGKRIFLTGGNEEEQAVYAFDSWTGDILWRTSLEAVLGFKPRMPKTDGTTGTASPTAATDGKRVYAMFASGHLIALEAMTGRIAWYKDFGIPDNPYGIASSPLLVRDLVIVQFDQSDKSLVTAFQGRSGRLVWEAERRLSPSWASPVRASIDKKDRVILVGNPDVECRDAETGRLLWATDCMYGETAPSAACGGGRIFAGTSIAGMIALDDKGQKLWEAYDEVPDVSSPVCLGERVYMVSSRGGLSCLDAATGEYLWTEYLNASVNASPLIAGGRIYVPDQSGLLHWIDEAPRASGRGALDVGGEFRATPAFAHGRVFLRSPRELVCLGATP